LRRRRVGLVDLDEPLQQRATRIDRSALPFVSQPMAGRNISAGVNRIPGGGNHGRVRRNRRKEPHSSALFPKPAGFESFERKHCRNTRKGAQRKTSIAFFDRPRHFIDADYRICDRRVLKEQEQG
jgi:hypothetical protein